MVVGLYINCFLQLFYLFQPMLSYILFGVTGALGVLIHYVIPQLRKQLPWLLVASPIFKSYEHNLYEWQGLKIWSTFLLCVQNVITSSKSFPKEFLNSINLM